MLLLLMQVADTLRDTVPVDTLTQPDTIAQLHSFTTAGWLGTLIALLLPILTAFVTKWVVNMMKYVNAFAERGPVFKQVTSFVIAFVISMLTARFGSTDIGVILNTLIGALLAQVSYNGQKLARVNVPYTPTATRNPAI